VSSDPARARSLRILVVNWQDRENPQAGGAEEHLHETFGRLARRGHEVTLLVSGWPGCPREVKLDGMEIHRTGGRYTFSVAAPRYFRRRLAGRRFDVVVEDLNKIPVFARYWTDAPVVPLVHHLFGATAFREATPPLAALTWLLERPVPRLFTGSPAVAVSESTREDLVARGMQRDLIEVIPNGIDLEMFSPGPMPERYEVPTVLYLGRVKRYKRIDLILKASARLKDRGLVFRVVVAGKGEHLPALRRLVERLDLGDLAELRGFVSTEEKLELFRRSWVHALTSPKEGWGIANLEAAACGTPTVASDSPGLRDSVVHGETGYLVPHGKIDVLSSRLEALLSDAELTNRLGRGARRFAEGYSWESSADAMEDFLGRCASVVVDRRRD
jgi:glycosyltransferase involved in cell wall biosynthesis